MSMNKNKDLSFLIGLKTEELEVFAENLGEKKFRGRQIFDWIYNQNIDNVILMTDLPKLFREKLKNFPIRN